MSAGCLIIKARSAIERDASATTSLGNIGNKMKQLELCLFKRGSNQYSCVGKV
jgi:hypothetical protein